MSRIVGGKEVDPRYRLPYQALVYVSGVYKMIMMAKLILNEDEKHPNMIEYDNKCYAALCEWRGVLPLWGNHRQ